MLRASLYEDLRAGEDNILSSSVDEQIKYHDECAKLFGKLLALLASPASASDEGAFVTEDLASADQQ